MSPPPSGATAGTALSEAVDEAAIVGATRTRVHSRIPAPDRRSGLISGGSFTLVLGAWLVLEPPQGASLTTLLACIVAHAAAASVEFEIGPGSALPTTPVLAVSLFLLPPPLVPFVAVSGLVIAALLARMRDPGRHERLAVLAGSGWHAVGPAAVFSLAGVTGPSLGDGGIYLLALGAQFLLDWASSWVRNCYGLGVPVRRLVGALRFTFLTDMLLAPVGLAAALAAPGSAAALLFVMPAVLLLAMLQLDRQRQISRAVALGDAVTEASDRARRDALTGLRNRLAWEETVARCADASGPLGVILADVDGLKAANDRYGHGAGDGLLVAVAGLIARATPAGGDVTVARLGGDEFGILLPGRLADQAEQVAESLRLLLADARPVDGVVAVRASVGVGTAPNGASLPAAFAEADRRVYEDKRRGGAPRS